jgi:hypothetical protein
MWIDRAAHGSFSTDSAAPLSEARPEEEDDEGGP